MKHILCRIGRQAALKLLYLITSSEMGAKGYVHFLFWWFLMADKYYRPNYLGLIRKNTAEHYQDWLSIFSSLAQNSYRSRQLKSEGIFFPAVQLWFITTRCTQQCGGCLRAVPQSETMTIDDWVRLGEEAIDNGAMAILILGGEPMLKKDMIKEIKRRLGLRIFFVVFTNGDLVTEQDVRDFNRLGIVLAVNIGSGRKSDSGAMRTLEYGRRNHGFIAASITITQKNYEEVTSAEYLEWLRENGAVIALFFHYMPCGADNDAELILTEEAFWEVESRLVSLRSTLRVMHYSRCYCAHDVVVVESDGRVRLCAFCTGAKSLGNVCESSMLTIFNSPDYSALRLAKTGRSCMIFNQTDYLEQEGHISSASAAAVKECPYPCGYVREQPGFTRVTVTARNGLFARED